MDIFYKYLLLGLNIQIEKKDLSYSKYKRDTRVISIPKALGSFWENNEHAVDQGQIIVFM